jgi:hypothetical protein
LNPWLRKRSKNGWVIFNVPVSDDIVQVCEEAEYDEEFRHALSPPRSLSFGPWTRIWVT